MPPPRLPDRLSLLATAACALLAVAAEAPPLGAQPATPQGSAQNGSQPPAKGAVHASETPPEPEPEPNATVSGVTVRASHAIPKIESTFPAPNAKVAPGLLILRATFSEKMRPDGWSYVPSAKGAYPDCAETPRLLDDRRTFVLICRTLPNKTYAVWFNQPPVVDFSSSSGRSAIPYELTFTTADDEPVRTLADAMKADKALNSASNPVEPLGSAPLGQPRVPPQ